MLFRSVVNEAIALTGQQRGVGDRREGASRRSEGRSAWIQASAFDDAETAYITVVVVVVPISHAANGDHI